MNARLATLSVCALAALSSVASANFRMKDVRTPITVDGVSYDRVTFHVRNDGVGGTGTKLLGFELTTFNSSAPMRFTATTDRGSLNRPVDVFINSTPDGVNDIDLTAANVATATSTRFRSEYYNPAGPTNPLGTWFGYLGANYNPNPSVMSRPGYNPATAYAGITSLYTVGMAISATAPVASDPTNGVAFLSVITAPGATVSLAGQVGGEVGSAGLFLPWDAALNAPGDKLPTFAADANPNWTNFSYVAAVPEPASLGLITLATALVRRRRI